MSVQKNITIRDEDQRILDAHPEICLSRLVQSAIQQYKKKHEGNGNGTQTQSV
jgi:predicted RNase H-like nuclease